MNIKDKTKEQLLYELEELRKYVATLEEVQKKHKHMTAELLESKELYRSILEASPN